MAKTSGPLFSLTASGKFAGAAVYSIWKGIPYVRQLVTPANPQSSGQQAQRLLIAEAGKVTKVMDKLGPVAVFLRSIMPNGQSDVSYYTQQMLIHAATSHTDYTNGSNATVAGYFDSGASDANIEAPTVTGAANSPLAPGEALWNAYQTAYVLGSSDVAGAAVDASSTNVDDFVTALTSHS